MSVITIRPADLADRSTDSRTRRRRGKVYLDEADTETEEERVGGSGNEKIGRAHV